MKAIALPANLGASVPYCKCFRVSLAKVFILILATDLWGSRRFTEPSNPRFET